MNKENLIKAISKSQDNNVLVKKLKVSKDDYISQIILEAVNNNTDDVNNEVDLDGAYNDLSYAINQLKKALQVVYDKSK